MSHAQTSMLKEVSQNLTPGGYSYDKMFTTCKKRALMTKVMDCLKYYTFFFLVFENLRGSIMHIFGRK